MFESLLKGIVSGDRSRRDWSVMGVEQRTGVRPLNPDNLNTAANTQEPPLTLETYPEGDLIPVKSRLHF